MQKNCKATFVLPEALLSDLRVLLDAGMANSLIALVREGLEFHSRRLHESLLEREFQEAAADPLFMADLTECMRDFEKSTADGLDG